MTDKLARTRRSYIIGAVIGAMVTIGISIMMDVLYASALGGTWRDAIALDLKRVFSVALPPTGVIVTALFGVILLLLGAVGALFGMVFVLLMGRFMRLLGS